MTRLDDVSDIAWWVYVLWFGIGVLVGWWIGTLKGYPLLGAVLGVFTVVGWLIIALIPRRDVASGRYVADHATTSRPPDLPPGTMPPHPHSGTPPSDTA